MSLFHLISPAVSSINDLIATASDVGAQLNLPSSPEEAVSGRWKALTYLPAIAAGSLSVAQLVGCVAHAILGNIPQSVFHGVSAFVSCYTAVCVASYIPLMSLEGYAKALAQKVKQLGKIIKELQTSNQYLDTTVKSLSDENSRHLQELKQKKKEIKEAFQKLDSTVKKLDESEKKILSLQKILDGFQKTTGEVSTKINQFVDMNKRLSLNSEELSKQLQEMKSLQESLQFSVVDIDEHQTNLMHEKKEAEKVASLLFQQFNQLIEIHVQLKKEKEALASQIIELQKNASSVEKNVASLEIINDQIEQKREGVKATVENLVSIASNLELLNAKLKNQSEQKLSQQSSKNMQGSASHNTSLNK